jgi:hypothetical protein
MNGHKISSKEIYVALAQRKEDRRTFLEAQMRTSTSPTHQSPNISPVPARQQLKQTEVAEAIPAQLTVAALEAFSAETQRQMLGERIYSVV